MYVGPVPEGRHMFVFQVRIHCFAFVIAPIIVITSSVTAEIIHCWWIILLALSPYSCRPIRPTRTRSPRRIWSGSLWFSSLAHTDLQVIHSIFGIISRHTFLIFRIHPCWLLCEHWLHWAWAERGAPLPPSLGETPAQHLGHQSQVLLKLWICDWNKKINICLNPSLCQSDQVQDQLGRQRGSCWELRERSAQERSKSAFWQLSGRLSWVETLFFLTFISSVDGHSPEINQWFASSNSLNGDWIKHFHDVIKKSNQTKVCHWKTNTSTS